MKLTKKKAIEISIELWTWLAETGKWKCEWHGWEKYGKMNSDCPLCEYSTQQGDNDDVSTTCHSCPLGKQYGGYGCFKVAYGKWSEAKQIRTRKKYAKVFLEQLKEL